MKRITVLLPLLVVVSACGETNDAASTTTAAPAPTTTAPPRTTVVETTVVTIPATSASTTQAPVAGSLESPIPLGTAAPIARGWTLKILAYNPSANDIVAASSQYNEAVPDGSVYIIFTVEMTYNGDGEHAEMSPYLALESVGPTQTEYDGFQALYYASAPDPAFPNVDVVPIGSVVSGNIVQFVDVADAVGLIAFSTDILSGGIRTYFATS